MSYDFELFKPGNPREVRIDDGFEAGARDAAKEAAKRRVADLLIAHDPRLQETVFDYNEIAMLHRIRVEDAHERVRRVELSDIGPGGSGAQVTLYDDSAAVTIPFWHQGEAARQHLERVWRYIDILCSAGSYEVFDPQLDRTIDRNGFEDVLASYESAMRRVSGVRARRPWWRFWGGGA